MQNQVLSSTLQTLRILANYSIVSIRIKEWKYCNYW